MGLGFYLLQPAGGYGEFGSGIRVPVSTPRASEVCGANPASVPIVAFPVLSMVASPPNVRPSVWLLPLLLGCESDERITAATILWLQSGGAKNLGSGMTAYCSDQD